MQADFRVQRFRWRLISYSQSLDFARTSPRHKMATARLTQAWSPLRQAIASSSTSSSSATASSSSASALRCFSSSAASSYAAPIPPRSLPTSQAEAKTRPPRNPLEQAVQYPRHPLNAFFHFAQGPNEDSPAIPAAVIPDLDLGEKTASSRSWRAPELRRKSSMELHQLWYIMSMERNRLATKWDELKRVGAQTNARQVGESITSRMKQVSCWNDGESGQDVWPYLMLTVTSFLST